MFFPLELLYIRIVPYIGRKLQDSPCSATPVQTLGFCYPAVAFIVIAIIVTATAAAAAAAAGVTVLPFVIEQWKGNIICEELRGICLPGCLIGPLTAYRSSHSRNEKVAQTQPSPTQLCCA